MTKLYKILMIDDEEVVLRVRKKFLNARGCTVDTALNTMQAIKCISENKYDCIILDVMLEETGGFAFCRTLKEVCDCPIIFLSNLSEEEHQVEGFLSGADEYIPKLASLELFWLRVEARIKAYRNKEQGMKLEFDPLVIDLVKRTIEIENKLILMTSIEFDILVLLASNLETVFSAANIYKEIWKTSDLNQTQTIQVHISRMRGKLEKAFPRHYFIQTVWGEGYHFVPI